MGRLPLSDVLVVEVGVRIGAGVCGAMLAQLGATTVVVEQSAGLEQSRRLLSAGKLSVRISAQSVEDVNLLRNLLSRADVIVASSDLDSELCDLSERGELTEQVVCDVTAYGKTGPCAGRGDSEWQIQAVSGLIDTTGMPDSLPVPIELPVVEHMTGVYAAAATVAALRVRRQCGAGQTIDMALYDCAIAAMATFLPNVLAGSKKPIKRAGNRHNLISPWNTYKAQDGWILICAGSDAQWRRLCEVMGRCELTADTPLARATERLAARAEVDAIVQSWVEQHPLGECERMLNEASIANGAIVSIDPYPQELNLDHRGMIRRLTDPETGRDLYVPGSPLRMSRTPGRAPDRLTAANADRETIRRIAASPRPANPATELVVKAPLAGIRVLEIGHYTTVPLSTRHMGALGADVIKIEPPGGESTRAWEPTRRGQGLFFTYMNSDKRSLVLDLGKDEDAHTLKSLITGSDVLIENLKPGALARRGFSPAEVANLNPRLIYCGVSGFGLESLYAGRPAYDSVIQAMSGLMDVVRTNGQPVKTGISVADLLGAEVALLAVLAALEHRDLTGEGQHIDLSMQDSSAWMTQMAWNGEGTDIALTLVECSDGYAVAHGDHAAVAGAGGGVIDSSTTSLSCGLERDELCTLLASRGVRAAPIRRVHEIAAAAQTKARRLWFEVESGGEVWPLMASPLRLSRTPAEVTRPMPPLGLDSEQIRAMAEQDPRSAS